MSTELLEITVLAGTPRDPDRLRRQRAEVASAPHVQALCNAVPTPVIILDRNRQIVLANQACLEFVGADDVEKIIGEAPGNILQCEHAVTAPGGCGTTDACRRCGAAISIESAAHGQARQLPCVIVVAGRRVPLHASAAAAPIEIAGARYIVLSFIDREDEERRRVLERLFFHDVLNTAGALAGIVEILPTSAGAERDEFERMLGAQARRLVEEIQSQRDLTAAEAGTLTVTAELVDLAGLMQEVVAGYRYHPVAWDRHLVYEPTATSCVQTDPALLGRAVGNLIKNALEATSEDGTVTVSHRQSGDEVEVRVHNPGAIPPEIARNVFQRPVSTKGPGRGLGTYSVRLLVEEYLDGKVSFTSDEAAGTSFIIRLPSIPAAE